MKKRYITAVLLLLVGTLLFAEIPAVVKSVTGKVEIKAAGGSWKKASVGMKITKGDFISTGFNSKAVLVLGKSQVIVRQLTRMELSKLIEKEGTVHTGLNLRVGRVRVKVNQMKGLKQDFRLKSPISTAAVRGTSFEYDGRNLTVYDGTVAFTTPLGQQRLVPAGMASKIAGAGIPKNPEEIKSILSRVIPSTLEIPEGINVSELLDMLSGLTNVSIVLDWGGTSTPNSPQ